MRVIIAGSRNIDPLALPSLITRAVMESGLTITQVVSGTARGVDQAGERWAMAHNIPIRRFPADWSTNGRSAGYIRNAEMGAYADAAVLIWDGSSKGTAHMRTCMEAQGKPVYVLKVG